MQQLFYFDSYFRAIKRKKTNFQPIQIGHKCTK
jgi:hypothetical protein